MHRILYSIRGGIPKTPDSWWQFAGLTILFAGAMLNVFNS